MKLVGNHLASEIVRLVGRDDHRLVAAPQKGCNLLVAGHQAIDHVGEQDDDVCLVHGDLCLLADARQHLVRVVEHQSPGVDHGKDLAPPLHVRIVAVARGTGDVPDDGQALAGQPVEERGLAHVRASHKSDDRFPGHVRLVSFGRELRASLGSGRW